MVAGSRSVARLLREHPEWFGPDATYAPVATTTTHAFGFVRAGEVVTVATRRPHDLADAGGWRDAVVVLPEGSWTDLLTGRVSPGGSVAVADLLGDLPVALLTRAQP